MFLLKALQINRKATIRCLIKSRQMIVDVIITTPLNHLHFLLPLDKL